MDWPALIHSITTSGVKRPNGLRWSFRAIAKEIGTSKSSIERLANRKRDDPPYTIGKALVDLYLKVKQQAEQEAAQREVDLEEERSTPETYYRTD